MTEVTINENGVPNKVCRLYDLKPGDYFILVEEDVDNYNDHIGVVLNIPDYYKDGRAFSYEDVQFFVPVAFGPHYVHYLSDSPVKKIDKLTVNYILEKQ